MKKLLLQVDTDTIPSTFDTITAYDAGVDSVIPYAGVTPDTAGDVATGAIFTRGGEGLKSTAIFVGGKNVALGEQVLAAITKAFFGSFRVSAMLDTNGCNTTAAAAVARVHGVVDLAGRHVVVTGSGPVGTRAAGLLGRAGARVTMTHIREASLQRGVEQVRSRFGVDIRGVLIPNNDVQAWTAMLKDVVLLFGAAAAGVQVVPKAAWQASDAMQVIIDTNLVPPAGIEGVEVADNLAEREGVRFLGPVGLGNFKMKVHRAAVQALFESNSRILDVDEIYGIARGLL